MCSNGCEVSTKQLAKAARVAEETLFGAFGAFGDEDTIIPALINRDFEPNRSGTTATGMGAGHRLTRRAPTDQTCPD